MTIFPVIGSATDCSPSFSCFIAAMIRACLSPVIGYHEMIMRPATPSTMGENPTKIRRTF
eukprot:TRINITY_DN14679_c0_g1_i1.p1 TRINITY_DN14679_c0_g1~~TRINITY_DN14679_c0_g1_i1.p1  ORF type:complete len:60 (+),score=3.03 TRINITY_DN14679_c0_g1_i1:134-313(+)